MLTLYYDQGFPNAQFHASVDNIPAQPGEAPRVNLTYQIEEGEQMFTALKFLGCEVKMVRFEGQSHDLSRNGHPRSRVIRLREIVDWFTAHIPTSAARPREVIAAGVAGE